MLVAPYPQSLLHSARHGNCYASLYQCLDMLDGVFVPVEDEDHWGLGAR
jgi:hypothetical protein